MALGYIALLFYSYIIISVLGIGFLFLTKNLKLKKIIFYLLSIWGMFISVQHARSLPSNLVLEQILGLSIGFLSVIGIIVHIKAKVKFQYNISYGLTIISIIIGILRLFAII